MIYYIDNSSTCYSRKPSIYIYTIYISSLSIYLHYLHTSTIYISPYLHYQYLHYLHISTISIIYIPPLSTYLHYLHIYTIYIYPLSTYLHYLYIFTIYITPIYSTCDSQKNGVFIRWSDKKESAISESSSPSRIFRIIGADLEIAGRTVAGTKVTSAASSSSSATAVGESPVTYTAPEKCAEGSRISLSLFRVIIHIYSVALIYPLISTTILI